MAITTMRRMPAHPMDSTDRAISTTAFSSVWAHGLAGDTVTAGAAIASAMGGEEVIAGAEAARSIRLQPAEELVPAHRTLLDRITAHRMPPARVQVQPGQLHCMRQ